MCLCNEAFIKTQKDRVSEQVEIWGAVAPGEGRESPCPFPMPCPMHLFHLAVPKSFYNKLVM